MRLFFFLLLLLIAWFSLLPGGTGPEINLWDKAQHFSAYFLLLLLCDLAIRTGDRVLYKFVWIVFYSVVIECLQAFVPGRQFSLLDMLANSAGAGLAVVIIYALKHLKAYQRLQCQRMAKAVESSD